MIEDPLAILGGVMHVRYGLTSEGRPLYLFGAEGGTPVDTLRAMVEAATHYVDRLEAGGHLTC